MLLRWCGEGFACIGAWVAVLGLLAALLIMGRGETPDVCQSQGVYCTALRQAASLSPIERAAGFASYESTAHLSLGAGLSAALLSSS